MRAGVQENYALRTILYRTKDCDDRRTCPTLKQS